MSDKYLYEKLTEYGRTDSYPFHMPGHKRRLGGMADPYFFDITEIDGFDNLHHAEGILLEAQRRAARLYGAEETYFLVNGSTAGILSAVGACLPSGKILMARNCHKAAYHAVFLNHLEAEYLYPRMDGRISCDQVETALDADPQIGAVFITSPTYDGIVSDVKAIAAAAHRYGIPLIVDSAHGAHFGMHPIFPENAVKQGADLVIHSVHKTLPSLTQTALLHVGGSLTDRRKLKKMLGIYQTSSPSYVLMAAIDECVRILEEQGRQLFETFAGYLENFWSQMDGLQVLEAIRTDDPSKIVIGVGSSGMTGLELSDLFRERWHLEMEMAAVTYVLALTSVGDDEDGFERLAQAVLQLDRELAASRTQKEAADVGLTVQKCGKERKVCEKTDRAQNSKAQNGREQNSGLAEYEETGQKLNGEWIQAEAVMTIAEAENSTQTRIPMDESAGRISGEYIYLYPPGIPLTVPGERISRELLEQLQECRVQGYSLQGMEDYNMKYLWIVEEKQ